MADREITVPADLRVEIQDSRAADGITPDGLRAYLEAHGWYPTGRVRRVDLAQQWARDGATLRALVPVDPDDMEYRPEVLTAIRRIAEGEGRAQLAVVADLRAASGEGDGDGEA